MDIWYFVLIEIIQGGKQHTVVCYIVVTWPPRVRVAYTIMRVGCSFILRSCDNNVACYTSMITLCSVLHTASLLKRFLMFHYRFFRALILESRFSCKSLFLVLIGVVVLCEVPAGVTYSVQGLRPGFWAAWFRCRPSSPHTGRDCRAPCPRWASDWLYPEHLCCPEPPSPKHCPHPRPQSPGSAPAPLRKHSINTDVTINNTNKVHYTKTSQILITRDLTNDFTDFIIFAQYLMWFL